MLVVSPMLDDMAPRKEIEFSSSEQKFKGLSDLGQGIESSSPAKEVLVIMVVRENCHFKLPLGYFFISGLSGQERANLLREALIKVYKTNANCVSLTCDGPSAHFTMLRELGACLDFENVSPSFSHPSDTSKEVNIFLDAAHMLKLIRNCFGSEKVLYSVTGALHYKSSCQY